MNSSALGSTACDTKLRGDGLEVSTTDTLAFIGL